MAVNEKKIDGKLEKKHNILNRPLFRRMYKWKIELNGKLIHFAND